MNSKNLQLVLTFIWVSIFQIICASFIHMANNYFFSLSFIAGIICIGAIIANIGENNLNVYSKNINYPALFQIGAFIFGLIFLLIV